MLSQESCDRIDQLARVTPSDACPANAIIQTTLENNKLILIKKFKLSFMA